MIAPRPHIAVKIFYKANGNGWLDPTDCRPAAFYLGKFMLHLEEQPTSAGLLRQKTMGSVLRDGIPV
jgi:hypothetical protein